MSERITWIDAVKGVGIVLVLFGHGFLEASGFGRIWIYSFHLGLFFFCTGYVFDYDHYSSLKTFLERKYKTLIIPYLLISFLCLLFNVIYNVFVAYLHSYSVDWIIILKRFIGIIIQIRNTDYQGYCWFILLDFVIDLFYYIIYSVTKNNSIKRWIIVVVLYILAGVYISTGGQPLPWHLDAVLLSLLFVNAGQELKTCSVLKGKYAVPAIIFSILIAMVEYKQRIRYDIFESVIGDLSLLLAGYSVGFIMVSTIVRQFSNLKMLEFLGRNSLVIYGLHQHIFYKVLKPLINTTFLKLFSSAIEGVLLEYFFTAILVLTVLVLIVTIIPMYKRVMRFITKS